MFSHWCSWSNNKAKYLIKVTVFLFLLTKFEAKDMEKMPLLNTVWMMKICNFMKYRAFGNICPRKHCVECLISEFPTNVWVFFEIFITVFYCGNKHLLCLNGCDYLYLLFSSRSYLVLKLYIWNCWYSHPTSRLDHNYKGIINIIKIELINKSKLGLLKHSYLLSLVVSLHVAY